MSSVTLYRACGLALLLGAVLVITGLSLSFVILGLVSLGSFVNVSFTLAAVLGLLGLGWMGYALLTTKGGEAEAVPQPVLAS